MMTTPSTAELSALLELADETIVRLLRPDRLACAGHAEAARVIGQLAEALQPFRDAELLLDAIDPFRRLGLQTTATAASIRQRVAELADETEADLRAGDAFRHPAAGWLDDVAFDEELAR